MTLQYIFDQNIPVEVRMRVVGKLVCWKQDGSI